MDQGQKEGVVAALRLLLADTTPEEKVTVLNEAFNTSSIKRGLVVFTEDECYRMDMEVSHVINHLSSKAVELNGESPLGRLAVLNLADMHRDHINMLVHVRRTLRVREVG